MIKKRKLEIAVLSLGALIILSALFLRFFTDLPPDRKLLISNMVFAFGFLVYIAYSILSTNNLNKEIRALNNEVDSLKKNLAEKNNQLEEKQKNINSLKEEIAEHEGEKSRIEKELTASKKEITALEKQIADLRSSKKEAKP